MIHGYAATPNDHWFAWLADEFEAIGVSTNVPELPDPAQPNADRWAETVASTLESVDHDTILVAHSLGCVTTLRYLADLHGDWTLGTLILVAGFLEPLPALPELDAFIADGLEVSALAAHIDRIVVLRSDADPYVPVEHTDRLAARLGVQAHLVAGAGHFLASDGIVELPEALHPVRCVR
ncbi:alpha/beta hydrolase [Luteipulveratus mongoliensis]|uniref:Alpha/beta hydrolase n=1 Tax=Luteipulveratus mongoliensis TaxID=571913 RepID=A0A0K1JR62_9MICO|nr:alpha/beta hydrolase [Luteipulveratus mongoliensis]